MSMRSRRMLPFAALVLGGAAILLPCAARAQCDAMPLTGCKQSTDVGKSSLSVKNLGGTGEDDKLGWKWGKGEETLPADFGDPTTAGTGTVYTLCIYDTNGGPPALVSQSIIPAGPPWEANGTKCKYKDKGGSNRGITKGMLKAGDAGKAKIGVKGKGSLLDTPPLPFAQNPTGIVQMSNDLGVCWESRFSPPVKKNDGEQFKAKSDAPLVGPPPTDTPIGGGPTPTPTPTIGGGGACGN